MCDNNLCSEEKRLLDNTTHKVFWKKWGPYLSERQWGTVREDYSEYGNAWEYFPHSHARSRAYRWGEDGIAGISDIYLNLCFGLSFWNGKDSILKERLFGLTGTEGNHGEDVKELYYYLDNTPTHSYMKYLYKYSQNKFPYDNLISTNKNRSRLEDEYEIIDTGIFNNGEYFDIFIEYAKEGIDDICISICIQNRNENECSIKVIPTLWFRNLWSFKKNQKKPNIKMIKSNDLNYLKTESDSIGGYHLYFDQPKRILFTENETNTEKLYNYPNKNIGVKDSFHDFIINNKKDISTKKNGTKAGILYDFTIQGKSQKTIKMRLCKKELNSTDLDKIPFIIKKRKAEADEFYYKILGNTNEDRINIQRQALAGVLWGKQYYNYEIERWLEGDEEQVKPPNIRKDGRNSEWKHIFNRDVISMPDKWEYPWYATWDLAFHCLPIALIDTDFAKKQILLFLREWYMHVNGQIPAYEWAFSDVNPPVHGWASLKIYKIEEKLYGKGDISFLKNVFHKLLLNFTWWVNRKDIDGNNIFQGGFLGLDNIGVFDRSKPLPTGGHLEQSDATSWMAMYSLNMMEIALEIANYDKDYEDVASKFFEHFVHIAESFNVFGKKHNIDLWDEEDGFFYDTIHYDDSSSEVLKTRSLVGLMPLFAVSVIDKSKMDKFSGFSKRFNWFRENRKDLNKQLIVENYDGKEKILFSLVREDRLIRILNKMLDENEFLSSGGIRSLSKYHKENAFKINVGSEEYSISYQPGESDSSLFGGNSNWRGPIWMPVNYLLVDSLKKFHNYFGDKFKIEFPTNSGQQKTLKDIAINISERLISIFEMDTDGKRPVFGNEKLYKEDKYFKDLILFYEYFNGDSQKGIGASHQTGWTALIANLIDEIKKNY